MRAPGRASRARRCLWPPAASDSRAARAAQAKCDITGQQGMVLVPPPPLPGDEQLTQQKSAPAALSAMEPRPKGRKT